MRKIRFNEFTSDGRTLCVLFKCCRCGKTEIEALKMALDRSGEVHHLNQIDIPKDWGTVYYDKLLCPACFKEFNDFLMKKGGDKNDERISE